MDLDSAPTSSAFDENRSALQRAVLAYERCSRPAHRARAARLEAEWIVLDQIEVRGARYALARCELGRHDAMERLTRRERQVLEFLADGHTTKVAAYELGIADATVRVLLVRAVRKLGARNRREALARYVEASRSALPLPAE